MSNTKVKDEVFPGRHGPQLRSMGDGVLSFFSDGSCYCAAGLYGVALFDKFFILLEV